MDLLAFILAISAEGITDEQVQTALNAYIAEHPEAVTTVTDGSITKAKLDSNLQGTVDDVSELKSALNNINGRLIEDYNDSESIWTKGNVSTSNGAINTAITNAIITADLQEAVAVVTCLATGTYTLNIHAYNTDGVYQGCYDGNGHFDKYSRTSLESCDICDIEALIPSCKYRVALVRKVNLQVATSEYVNVSIIAEKMLSKTEAASVYLSKSDAESDYLSKSDAESDYLSKADAENTYQPQTDAYNKAMLGKMLPSMINGYPVMYKSGYLVNGVENSPDSLSRRFVTIDFIWLAKGDTLYSNLPIEVSHYNDDFSYNEKYVSVFVFIAPADGYYKYQFELATSVTYQAPYIDGPYVFFGKKDNYSRDTVDAFNATAILQNPMIVSRDIQKMAHVSMMEIDKDNTIWMCFYANETTTKESNDDISTYIEIVHFNPYTKAVLNRADFAVGDVIGDYTQTTIPPYDPTITVLDDYVLLTFWSYVNGERAISCFRIDKNTMAFSNYNLNTIRYDGVDYSLTCSNMKSIYELYSGTNIGNITTIAFSTHFPKHNGYYYGVLNDVFNESGLKSPLVRSNDLIHWEVVHWFTEIPATNEASICIKDGIVYMADRNNGYISSYNLSSGNFKYAYIPLKQNCKQCIYNFAGTIVLATNITAAYDASNEGYRKNLGLFVVQEDLSCELKSRILTQSGIHYPDLVSDGNDLFLSWSEDRRHLDRMVQRSNIGFNRIII